MNHDNGSTAAVAAAIGLDAREAAARKAFLEFGAADEAALRALHARLAPHRERFLDAFYEHLGRVEELAPFLGDATTRARLTGAQARYFDQLTGGYYGDSYVLDRVRVGIVHQRVGIAPKYYLGAYRKYLAELIPQIAAEMQDGPQREALDALLKIVFFDIGLALETYSFAERTALERTEARARETLDVMPIGVAVVDRNLCVRLANDALRRMLGIDVTAPVTTLAELRVPPELSALVAEVLASGKRQRGRVLEEDSAAAGRALACDLSPTVIDGDAAVLVMLREFGGKERAEREVRRFRAALNASAEAILLVDPDNLRYVDANETATHMLGHTREELLGMGPLQVVPDATEAALRERYARLFAHGGAERVESELRRRDGTRLPVEVSLRGTAVDGEPLVIAVVSDLSERVRTRDMLRKLNQLLEKRVQERTAQLAAALAAVESFSYSVSHDLRAPVRAVCSFSALLESELGDRLDERSGEFLHRISSAGERMNGMIDGLLTLARLTRQELNLETVDVSALVRDIGAALAEAQPERRVELVVEEGMVVDGDRRLLLIAFQNLLGNAWKYTAKTAAPAVRCGTLVEEDGTRVFYVRDNGAGFDMAHAGKLFGAFQRLHSAAEFPGTGVGLATVARVIQRHGGRIWAEGAPGVGASFYFTLWDASAD